MIDNCHPNAAQPLRSIIKNNSFPWHFTARSLFKKFATSARDRLIHRRLRSLEKERNGATKIVSGPALSRQKSLRNSQRELLLKPNYFLTSWISGKEFGF